MRGRKSRPVVTLSSEERLLLRYRLRCATTPLGLARRRRAIPAVADGMSLAGAARQVGLTEKPVRKRVQRFLAHRLAGLHDRPGRGRKPVFSPLGGVARGQDRL